MSYFTTTRCNEWTYEKVLKHCTDNIEDENKAYKKREEHLKGIIDSINVQPSVKNKAEVFLKKVTSKENIGLPLDRAINHNNYNMKNNSNINNYYGNFNNVININGKRVNDIFNTRDDIGINQFTKKLLKTVNTSQDDREEEEEKEDEEEEEQLQINIIFPEEGHADIYSGLNNLIKAWKKNQIHEPLIHKQQLLY